MPKTVKTTYTAINLETGEVYTGIDAPQSITRGETHFWQASKDFFAALLGYGTVESKVVANLLHRTDPKTNHIACTLPELKKELSCTRDTVASAIKKMESKRLIIGIGQGVWMLNPRMLAIQRSLKFSFCSAVSKSIMDICSCARAIVRPRCICGLILPLSLMPRSALSAICIMSFIKSIWA